jgi:hypothetical protein
LPHFIPLLFSCIPPERECQEENPEFQQVGTGLGRKKDTTTYGAFAQKTTQQPRGQKIRRIPGGVKRY